MTRRNPPVPAVPGIDLNFRPAFGESGPSFADGGYLPPRNANEIVIAWVEFASVTPEVVALTAQRRGRRWLYRMTDEYDTNFTLAQKSSTEPLTLAQVVHMLDSADGDMLDTSGHGVVMCWPESMRENGETPEYAASYVSVLSEVYPQLAEYYQRRLELWVAEWSEDEEEEEEYEEDEDEDDEDDEDDESEPVSVPTPEEISRFVDEDERRLSDALQMNAMLGEHKRNMITSSRLSSAQQALYNAVHFETHFRGPHELNWGETPFVIISVCTPAAPGRVADAEREADEKLHAILTAFGRSPRRATAYVPGTGLEAPGWAVPIGELEGVRVARAFGRETIYLVRSRGELWVAACEGERDPALVGVFAASLAH